MGCPPRVVRGSARQAAIASGVNQTVRLPRARRAASYAAQFVTLCCCFGMWRRQAALALNGTAGIQASGKGPLSYTAQLPTPTGRSVQQGADEYDIYARLPAWGYRHKMVCHGRGEYARDEDGDGFCE